MGEGGRSAHAASLPTLVLYPRTLGDSEDVRALIDLRKKLRSDGQFQVLTYDPESAAMTRAAGDAHHPEWLTGPMAADADRLALTRALGADFYLSVAKAGRGKADVHLVEAAPAARAWTLSDKKTDDAAHQVEQQATDALQHPAPVAARPVPPPSSPVRVAVKPPAPAPPTVTTTPAPVPVVTAPVITPAPQPTPMPPPAAPVTPVPTNVPAATLPTVPPPALPVPAPPTPIAPAPKPPVKAAPPVDDLSSVTAVLSQGDEELARGNFVGAIARYREAINGAPLSVAPRLKLAQAYRQAGMKDRALDEAKRALEVAPDSGLVQQFLDQLDAESGTSEGAVTRYEAAVARDPQDPTAHQELGDALWNGGDLARAEAEYTQAQGLAEAGSPSAQTAAAHLARLLAAQSRYDESLVALKDAGAAGYALALRIVQGRADALSSTLESAQETFTAGKSTHADFYKTATTVSAQSQDLADFVIKVVPPPAFKLSHLYRVQATHLLAQQAAVLVRFIETSDPQQDEMAARLGKEAQAEMLTAHAAEEKLGLWGSKPSMPDAAGAQARVGQ